MNLKEMIAEAKECEKMARELREASGKSFFSCGFEYGSVDCHDCKHLEVCECNERVRSDAAQDAFAAAYAKYRVALSIARQAVQETDSAENYELLARLLLDIAIHPYTLNFKDSLELWEAQYTWLYLFFRTGQEQYLEQAKQCEAFRHAYAEEVKETKYQDSGALWIDDEKEH